MKISLIIPVYNEIATIDRCLKNLASISNNRLETEIIFADGGSSDGTVARIEDSGYDYNYTVVSCPKGRARQMNHAAKKASGDVLWFVHCDSVLPPDGPTQIMNAVQKGSRFGCFHVGFDERSFLMFWNTLFSNWRAGIRHIAFGDQGIFVEKTLFEERGGFPDLPIMEDYEFSMAMKRDGIKLHQLKGRIITSARRYHGHPLRVMLQMIYLRRLYRSGVDINEIARRYKDIR